MQDPATLVITARLDPDAFRHFDAMRQSLFPAGRNKVPAHVSLFHKLPAACLEALADDISAILPEASPDAETTGIRFLGQGSAYTLAAPGLMAVQAALCDRYGAHLTAQDRQRYAPHITVQNKADPAEARAMNDRLKAAFVPMRIVFAAVDLWLYAADGTWTLETAVAWA